LPIAIAAYPKSKNTDTKYVAVVTGGWLEHWRSDSITTDIDDAAPPESSVNVAADDTRPTAALPMGAFPETSNAGVVVAVLTDLDCDGVLHTDFDFDGDGRVLDALPFRIENVADSVAVGDRWGHRTDIVTGVASPPLWHTAVRLMFVTLPCIGGESIVWVMLAWTSVPGGCSASEFAAISTNVMLDKLRSIQLTGVRTLKVKAVEREKGEVAIGRASWLARNAMKTFPLSSAVVMPVTFE
jgi:hypothetical protein